jgi:AraC-like DNA-binding protein
MNSFYEIHHHPDPQFPFFFHLDSKCGGYAFNAHWHESIELLYCMSGNGEVTSDRTSKPFQPGDLAIINSNNIHRVYSDGSNLSYICLIADKLFTASIGLDVEILQFKPIVRHPDIGVLFSRIDDELKQKRPYYQAAVKAAVTDLMVLLSRNFLEDSRLVQYKSDSPQTQMMKTAINMIRDNFTKPVNIDAICQAVGFSRYYFCHVFKNYTGKTVVDYINFLRCCNARSLILSGSCNISESARMSGISNLSYFTRTYKKHMGVLPSEEGHVV